MSEASAPAVSLPDLDAETVRLYRLALAGELRHLKHYPPAAKSGGEEGVVDIHVHLGARGFSRVEVAGSSGFSALDDAALSMVRQAASRVAPPRILGRETVRISVPVRFSVTD